MSIEMTALTIRRLFPHNGGRLFCRLHRLDKTSPRFPLGLLFSTWIVCNEKVLTQTAGKLLLGDLYQLFGNIASKRACIASGNITVVTICRNLYAKLLSCLQLHLIQGLISLWNNKLVAAVASHDVFLLSSSARCCVASLQRYYVRGLNNIS